jgi:hypothetical protein
MAYNHLDLHPEAVAYIRSWYGADGGREAGSNPERPHLSLQQMRDLGFPGFVDVPYNFTGTRFELFIPTPNSSCKLTVTRFDVLNLKVFTFINSVAECVCCVVCEQIVFQRTSTSRLPCQALPTLLYSSSFMAEP